MAGLKCFTKARELGSADDIFISFCTQDYGKMARKRKQLAIGEANSTDRISD